MNVFKRLLLSLSCCAVVLCALVYTPGIQAYPFIPLKGLFKVLKKDDIGFAYSLMHSGWVENMYQFGPGAPHKEISGSWNAIKKDDGVANLVRDLWFRFSQDHSLEPSERHDAFKPLDPKKFGKLLNLTYKMMQKDEILKENKKVESYSTVKKKIEKIKKDVFCILQKIKRDIKKSFLDSLNVFKDQPYLVDEEVELDIAQEKKASHEYKIMEKELKEIRFEKSKLFKNIRDVKDKKRLANIQETEDLISLKFLDAFVVFVDKRLDIIAYNDHKVAIKYDMEDISKKIKEARELTESLHKMVHLQMGHSQMYHSNNGHEKCDDKVDIPDFKELGFLVKKIRAALKTCKEGRYVNGTTPGILWAFFLHRINKDFISMEAKVEAIKVCIDQISPEFKNDVKLDNLYSIKDFNLFEKDIKDLSASEQHEKIRKNYELSLYYLISSKTGKFPMLVSQGNYCFEYDTKDHKIKKSVPNCYEAAMLDFFSLLWYNPEKSEYDNFLFNKEHLNGEGFIKLQEAIKYIYVADQKGIKSEKYTLKDSGESFTSLLKLKELIKPEEIEKINIGDIPTSYIIRSEVNQAFMNIVSDKKFIEYYKGKIYELKPSVKNFVQLVCYFYGIDIEKVTDEKGLFDLSKLGEILSTDNRIITFKNTKEEDVPNEIKISIEDKNIGFSFDMTLDLLSSHAKLEVPKREAGTSGIIKKDVLKYICKDLKRKKQENTNFLTMLSSKKLLNTENNLDCSLLNLIYYCLSLKDANVKLDVIKDILRRPMNIYDQLKYWLYDLIDELSEDDYICRRVLYYVVASRKYEKDKKLKEHVEKKEIIKKHGVNIIVFAIVKENKYILNLLLYHKDMNINELYDPRNTPLIIAIKKGNKEIVELLLTNKKIDVNKAVKYEEIPLALAIEKGNKEIVELLLANEKINVNKPGKCKQVPLLFAIKKGNKEIVELLLSHKNIDVNKGYGYYNQIPLLLAIEEGDKEIVELLLSHKNIDVNKVQGYFCEVPLISAIKNGYIDIAKKIINHKSIEKNIKRVDWSKVLEQAKKLLKDKKYKEQERDILEIIGFIKNKIEQVKKLKEISN